MLLELVDVASVPSSRQKHRASTQRYPRGVEVCERLLAAIEARDYAAIENCFMHDAMFRALTPHRLREHTRGKDAAAQYRYWLEPLDDFQLVERDCAQIADRVRIRYRFRGVDPQNGPQENEHTGYAAVKADTITRMNLTCAGFRPATTGDST